MSFLWKIYFLTIFAIIVPILAKPLGIHNDQKVGFQPVPPADLQQSLNTFLDEHIIPTLNSAGSHESHHGHLVLDKHIETELLTSSEPEFKTIAMYHLREVGHGPLGPHTLNPESTPDPEGWSTLTICIIISVAIFVFVWILFWIIFYSERKEFQRTQRGNKTVKFNTLYLHRIKNVNDDSTNGLRNSLQNDVTIKTACELGMHDQTFSFI